MIDGKLMVTLRAARVLTADDGLGTTPAGDGSRVDEAELKPTLGALQRPRGLQKSGASTQLLQATGQHPDPTG
ncbi:MAG: hypothetical protein APZ16_02215 [Candidatus Hadarchaeum yellowstonense]|uniref:Uncharacterized protein n=1 Tax=Hadarchaeum yellowstonense TaxID=1776334 RepID=A0A147JWD8_HADYE|nr:MAG: hypothetical protein APZ16_02215 [Candidatus Hadarchaeum yellowstonense]